MLKILLFFASLLPFVSDGQNNLYEILTAKKFLLTKVTFNKTKENQLDNYGKENEKYYFFLGRIKDDDLLKSEVKAKHYLKVDTVCYFDRDFDLNGTCLTSKMARVKFRKEDSTLFFTDIVVLKNSSTNKDVFKTTRSFKIKTDRQISKIYLIDLNYNEVERKYWFVESKKK